MLLQGPLHGVSRLLMCLLYGHVLPQRQLRPVQPRPDHAQRGRQGLVQLDVPVQELQGQAKDDVTSCPAQRLSLWVIQEKPVQRLGAFCSYVAETSGSLTALLLKMLSSLLPPKQRLLGNCQRTFPRLPMSFSFSFSLLTKLSLFPHRPLPGPQNGTAGAQFCPPQQPKTKRGI